MTDRATIHAVTSRGVYVSAPMGMQREVVELQITASRPAGLGWRFVTRSARGEPLMPRPCPFDPYRLHWLLTRRVA